MQLTQHKKIYSRYNKDKSGNSKQVRKHLNSSIRGMGKEEIKQALQEEANGWYNDDFYYDDDYCCSHLYAPICSSCKAKLIYDYLEIDTNDQNRWFIEDLVFHASDYIWSSENSEVFIIHRNIKVRDIPALIDLYTKPETPYIEWLIHPDAGIRILANEKYARTTN